MPIYISSSSSSPLMNFIVSVAVLAVTVGLFIFFLPVIGFIVIAFVACIALFVGWKWLKQKFGWESPDERMFRETMEQMERNARAQFQDQEEAASSGVYAREETVVTSRRIQRRRMDDVEDIESTPVTPNEK